MANAGIAVVVAVGIVRASCVCPGGTRKIGTCKISLIEGRIDEIASSKVSAGCIVVA